MSGVSLASAIGCIEMYGRSQMDQGYRQGLAFAACRLETLMRQGDGARHEDLKMLLRDLDEERKKMDR